jgi:hypothetical protein
MEKQNLTDGVFGKIRACSDPVIRGVKRQLDNYAIGRIEEGIRHENHRYNGFFDKLVGMCSGVKYSVSDIKRGKIEKPVYVQGHQIGTEEVEVISPLSPYKIGRYMAKADRLMRAGLRGEIDAALDANSIYDWLGQGSRMSIRNKMQRVYDNAVKLSKEHNVPLVTCGDMKQAIMPQDIYYDLCRTLNIRF